MINPKKICFLTTTPLIVQFFLKRHLFELAEMYDITLAFNPENDNYIQKLGISVKEKSICIKREISLVGDIVALWQIYRLLRHGRYDMVVSVSPKAGLLGMLAAFLAGSSRRVHIFQGEIWASRTGFSRCLLKRMDWLVAKLSTHRLAVSHSERKFLEEERVVCRGDITVLGAGSICGVDRARFKQNTILRQQIRVELGIKESEQVCLFLGRLTQDKGILDLIEAFSICAHENEEIHLLVVGPDEDGIKRRLPLLLKDDMLKRVSLLGYTSTPERFIAAADFLCLPSYREGFGMVILEAAAHGIPAIGTDIYGIQDAIIDGETGLLFELGNIDALAQAIAAFATDPDLRMRMGGAAMQRVDREFKSENVVKSYVDYFVRICPP